MYRSHLSACGDVDGLALGDSAEVRGLVAALTAKVQGGREELTAQAVGNEVYGLKYAGVATTLRSSQARRRRR